MVLTFHQLRGPGRELVKIDAACRRSKCLVVVLTNGTRLTVRASDVVPVKLTLLELVASQAIRSKNDSLEWFLAWRCTANETMGAWSLYWVMKQLNAAAFRSCEDIAYYATLCLESGADGRQALLKRSRDPAKMACAIDTFRRVEQDAVADAAAILASMRRAALRGA